MTPKQIIKGLEVSLFGSQQQRKQRSKEKAKSSSTKNIYYNDDRDFDSWRDQQSFETTQNNY